MKMSEFNTDEPEAAKNTDTLLFSEVEDDYYSPSCHMTKGRALGINVGGTVVIKPLREWFKAIAQLKECREELKDRCADLEFEYNGRIKAENEIDRLEKQKRDQRWLLEEWLATPFFDTEEAWAEWAGWFRDEIEKVVYDAKSITIEQRTKDDIKARIISSFAGHDIHSLDPVNITIDEILEAIEGAGH